MVQTETTVYLDRLSINYPPISDAFDNSEYFFLQYSTIQLWHYWGIAGSISINKIIFFIVIKNTLNGGMMQRRKFLRVSLDKRFSESKSRHWCHLLSEYRTGKKWKSVSCPMWPDWTNNWTLGHFYSFWQQLICPNLPHS